jgi:prepilin-type N-terminal cleavage/methylation domain-containing protein
MTCSAQTHTKIADSVERTADRKTKLYAKRYTLNAESGFTMAELLVVLAVISLFVMLTQMHLFGLLRKNTFRAQTQELVSTTQSYGLKHITGPEIYVDRPDETPGEIIAQNDLTDNCRIVYVWFDDGVETNTKAWFRAGPSSWQSGGKIVLLDEKEQPYSIVVNQLNRMVTLETGDVQLLEPKRRDELPF